jgi:hypothetical protein
VEITPPHSRVLNHGKSRMPLGFHGEELKGRPGQLTKSYKGRPQEKTEDITSTAKDRIRHDSNQPKPKPPTPNQVASGQRKHPTAKETKNKALSPLLPQHTQSTNLPQTSKNRNSNQRLTSPLPLLNQPRSPQHHHHHHHSRHKPAQY